MSETQVKVSNPFGFVYTIFAVLTAMVGHTVNHSIFWGIVDFFFAPLAWAKWLVCHEVNMTIIKSTFEFFFH
jgi:hypothetical protein